MYVVFCKGIDGKPTKYQFHFEDDQFMDVRDDDIDLAELVKKNPKLQDVPEFQGKKVVLTKNLKRYINKLIRLDPEVVWNDSRISPELLSKALNDSSAYFESVE